MDRHVAALVLEEIGSLLELQDTESFRVRAYHAAARALGHAGDDLAADLRSGALAAIPGLGPGTIGIVRELLETGRSRLYDRLRAETPAGLVQLRGVSGLGSKRIRTLHEKLGIETLEELRAAAQAGRIAALPGFGPATQRRILDGLAFVDRSAGRRLQPAAYGTADRLIGHLESLDVRAVHLTGELRRRCETVDGIDLLAVADRPAGVVEAFLALPALGRPERSSADAARGRLADGAAVRLRCVPPAVAAAARVVETGSAAHVAALAARAAARGLRLDGEGLWRAEHRVGLEDEEALYATLELEWVPPELREGRGEVEAAAKGRLPRLVDYDDLQGTFHCHTTWSDGRGTVAEMAAAAAARGWRYLGIADHSVSAGYAGGLSVDEVRRQHAEIDAWNGSRGGEVRLFRGVESDILRDGRLDYDDDVLASFDYVIGSVHSGFRMPGDEMTRRIRAAVANPRLDILGHPTGRLLLRREPYPVDVEAVIAAAAERGAAIEINGDPHRMDLDWRYWPGAKARGVRCAVNPDAHSAAGIGAVVYGLAMARKGGLEPEDVINTWDVERVAARFGGA
ncbi:MAG TPA: helix-hairpin-helix domain-containing protein [Longimicrobiales bacterium]|nr:helix-hairpin-helix domain-containing protein [Longimicrobiales bacterium]